MFTANTQGKISETESTTFSVETPLIAEQKPILRVCDTVKLHKTSVYTMCSMLYPKGRKPQRQIDQKQNNWNRKPIMQVRSEKRLLHIFIHNMTFHLDASQFVHTAKTQQQEIRNAMTKAPENKYITISFVRISTMCSVCTTNQTDDGDNCFSSSFIVAPWVYISLYASSVCACHPIGMYNHYLFVCGCGIRNSLRINTTLVCSVGAERRKWTFKRMYNIYIPSPRRSKLWCIYGRAHRMAYSCLLCIIPFGAQ